jgi:hypothetical protein
METGREDAAYEIEWEDLRCAVCGSDDFGSICHCCNRCSDCITELGHSKGPSLDFLPPDES